MKILAVVDLSESTANIVEKAEELAIALLAKLWLLHVAEPEPDFVGYDVGPQSVRDTLSQKFHDQHRQLQEIAERMRGNGIDATALLFQGSTVETILHEASRLDVDMIVIGSHGRGAMYHLLMGSVTEGVLHAAKCPILVVPTHNRK
ncbi:MAG: universal stress protein [Candidatus Thiodiazotropha sp. (ex. Lucinisca nassula)]|nr:universal stress protein [Candidatus Thiodiazotropha sp. (ex. Lucinisca nassula)]PUB79500.1 MAG: universal stress protein [gamma proteobacterium symbiont of Ctena orbiculata]PUB85264.1 MAG: universal stress protein [gamma proteobacterium symbiont of Ctena orbiculata]